MRDYRAEFENRVAFIRNLVEQSHVKGIVFGNSGGKDCALVGILCKAACSDTVSVLLPCASSRNYGSDTDDALALVRQFGIESRTVDLTAARAAMVEALKDQTELTDAALANIAPRLRMNALYAIAGAENRLVAGTGNRSEVYMGYLPHIEGCEHSFYEYDVTKFERGTGEILAEQYAEVLTELKNAG